MNRIENGSTARRANPDSSLGRSPMAINENRQVAIHQPSSFDIEQVVSLGQMRADELLERVNDIVGTAGCELEIINDIQLQELADGTRSVVMKRTTRLQKDPS